MIGIDALQDVQPLVSVVVGGSFAAATAAVAGLAVQTRAKRRAEEGAAAARREAAEARQAHSTAEQQAKNARKHGEDARERAGQAEAEAERARTNATTSRRWLDAVLAELRHTAEFRLPAVVDVAARDYRDVVEPGLLHTEFDGTDTAKYLAAITDLVRESAEVARQRTGGAARAGVGAVADDARAVLIQLQQHIDEELGRHPGADAYHQSLVAIDRYAALAVHRVQRLQILAGSWPGLQRDNCPLSVVIEGARGRIFDYDRVHYTYLAASGEQHLEGRVVEPVALALTELMANATACSTGPVQVYVQQYQTGWCIVVKDGGIGMNAAQRAQARAVLDGSDLPDATSLPDARSLGFAVVGLLARTYGFRASVDTPSTMGGVQAEVFIPNSLTAEGPSPTPAPGRRHEARPAPEPASTPSPEAAAPTATTAGGLPKRQPKTVQAATPAPAPTWSPVTADTDPDALAAGFARRARVFAQAENEATDTPSGEQHA